jgi:predicted nucleotidyltransferase component of viral defense system
MRLHSNKELFTDAIRVTAQKMNIPPEFVEKDYWVTFALFSIFTNEIGAETIFKGGTALSKCFSIIERFSEDIDLVVLRSENESANQLKNKLKKVTKVVSENLEEIEVNGITNKLGMIRKIAYNYKKEFIGTFLQVRDVIIVEATWLGRFEPFHRQEISSYIYEMMLDSEQLELAKEFGMLPFEVQVLHVNRTICEKIMSLVRFSYGENPLDNLKNKIRHTYDIHQLLQVPEVNEFFNTTAFDQMLLLVAQDDRESFKNNNEWLAEHPKDALLFRDTDNVWSKIENTYTSDFRNLVHGKLPAGSEILQTLRSVSSRLKDINW